MTLKRIVVCVVVFVGCAITTVAQQYAFLVTFADKTGTADITTPLVFLSQRALDRRSALGIAVDNTDLPVSPVYINDILNTTGGKFHVASKWLNSCVILVPDSSQMATVRSKSFVVGAKYIAWYASALHRTTTPTPSGSTYTPTGDASYYGNTFTQTQYVKGDYLHDHGYKGSGKLIAVLDAGFIDVDTHPGFNDLRQSGRILEVHNFVLASNNVYAYDSHGTKALSTMAGNIPGTYVGSAPEASYALYVTEDNNSEQPIEMWNMVAATERADSLGADIVSESLGYNIFDDFRSADLNYGMLTGDSTPVAKAANMATRKGMLFVASAGNEGGGTPGWGNYILSPADGDSVLAIGSADVSKNPSGSSGFGPNARGVIKPDVCGLGVSAAVLTTGGGTGFESGTSFSTPQIAGWAACLWQAAGNVLPYKIRSAINRSADHYTNPGNQLGYGIPDFSKAFENLNIKDAPDPNTGQWITASPNPFNADIDIAIHLPVSQEVSFALVDMSGRTVVTEELIYLLGANNMKVVVPSFLPKGVYLLKATAGNSKQTIKLVKR